MEASVVPLALLLTLIVGIGWQGAYYRGGQIALGLGLAFVAAASCVARSLRLCELVWSPSMAVLALGGWVLLNATIHGTSGRGYGGAALAFGVATTLLVVRRSELQDRLLLLTALPVVGALTATSAWLGLVLRIPGWSMEAQGLWRAAGTLTYSNATAAVLVPLAVLAVAGTASPRGTETEPGPRLVPTAAIRLMATLMVATVFATLSRGGFLALVVGLVCLVVLGGPAMLGAVGGPLLGAVVAFAGLVPSLPANTGSRPLPAVVGLIAGLAVAHLLGQFLERDGSNGSRPVAFLGVAAAGCLVIAAATITLGSQLWTVAEVRLSSGSTHRFDAARAAISLLGENPVLGTGPAGAITTWRDSSGARLTLRYLHNEYLQVLVENGAVGGFLLLTVLVACVLAARRGRRAPGNPVLWTTSISGAARTGGLAAVVAFAVSSAVDITWHLPVLPVLVATVFAVTLVVTPIQPPTRAATSV